MQRFEGRVVFVTGGGHGIGRATAFRLVEEGASVAVTDIDVDAATSVAQKITDLGRNAIPLACDVTDPVSTDRAIASAVQHFGRLDVLVNVAGGDWDEPDFAQISDETWNSKIDLNLSGVMRCIRAALPHLIASGPGSSVVSIGSVNGDAAFGGYPYSAAKAGLEILTKNLAATYGRQGVRFNLITPGTIRTRNWDGMETQLVEFAKMYPLQRIGEPDDIAAAVAFLASYDAAWVTGINLPVEGGILTGPRNAFMASLAES